MKKLVVLLILSIIGGTLAFDTCSSEKCEHSCKNRCGHKPNKKYSCQCNEHCERFGDCCDDYSFCKYIDPNFDEADHHIKSDIDPNFNKAAHHKKSDSSCEGRCGEKYNKKNTCHCNNKCSKANNCCTDYSDLCGEDTSSTDKKNKAATRSDSSPSGDSSCEGRCGEKYNKKNTCHCNNKCSKFNNCCTDYSDLCGGATSSTEKKNKAATSSDSSPYGDADITNEEIKEISEKLYQSDSNKAAESDIVLNKQEWVKKDTSRHDHCDEPLYQFVNEELFKKPTYAAFLNLLDNYDRKTGIDESYSPQEVKEQEHFLQEVMKTKPLKELYKFFHKKGLYTSEKEFTDDLQKMWFGLYSRSSGEADSSGFEHVFVGEVKKGKVSGFHSWIRFYHLEKKGLLNYFSHNYDGPWTSYPDVLGKQFHWDGFLKEVGSQFIGSSPEFDFAMYTLCFISRPGKKCTISMDGHEIAIRTYEWTKNTYGKGKCYIATAYPEV
ncbi:uridylate-specific endoribonuclease [Lithobates pipiens]